MLPAADRTIKAWLFIAAYIWADLIFNIIEAAYRVW